MPTKLQCVPGAIQAPSTTGVRDVVTATRMSTSLTASRALETGVTSTPGRARRAQAAKRPLP